MPPRRWPRTGPGAACWEYIKKRTCSVSCCDGVPLLEIRARQLADVIHIPNGSSLAFALFAEAARRDLNTLTKVHQELFLLQKEDDFLDMVDQIREAQRLPRTERPVF